MVRRMGRHWHGDALGRLVGPLRCGVAPMKIKRGMYLGRRMPDGTFVDDLDERIHFMTCPVCGSTFDMRDLGQALEHVSNAHEPPTRD